MLDDHVLCLLISQLQQRPYPLSAHARTTVTSFHAVHCYQISKVHNDCLQTLMQHLKHSIHPLPVTQHKAVTHLTGHTAVDTCSVANLRQDACFTVMPARRFNWWLQHCLHPLPHGSQGEKESIVTLGSYSVDCHPELSGLQTSNIPFTEHALGRKPMQHRTQRWLRGIQAGQASRLICTPWPGNRSRMMV